MSQSLINRSADLRLLQDEGYDLEIRSGHLLIRDVPYVTAAREVRRGTLVSNLTLSGDATAKPDTHVVHFAGEHPCDRDGRELHQIRHQAEAKTLADGVQVHRSFSSKPPAGYADYYEKMTTYAAILSGPAEALDPAATARTFPPVPAAEGESVFRYHDTASSRAGISDITAKLAGGTVAIVGLGGTGSYVLDLVAKTPVAEIHLFDGDVFSNHNAFRAPGAPTLEELRARPLKVEHLRARYDAMHRAVVAHPVYIGPDTVEQLRAMGFVFLCLDRGEAKRLIVERLTDWGIPFIDAGMGINLVGDALQGLVAVTTSTPAQRGHVLAKGRIPFADGPNEYATNIQIADLNALAAALAVIKWKKHRGFYLDLEREHYCAYAIDGNVLTNDDQP